VKDYHDVTMVDQKRTTSGTGAFSGSFMIGSSGAEGLWTLYAASGQGHASGTFYVDASAPSSSVSIPEGGRTVVSVSTISGVASDQNLADTSPGSGVASVAITIERISDSKYWTGGEWGAATWLPASGTTSWSYDTVGVTWTSSSYTIVSRATDVAGNVETPGAGNTFALDMNEYSLTITVAGTGTLAASPDNPHYHYGDVVQLTATPEVGWSFSAWSGGLVGNPTLVHIIGDTSVTATFTQNEYTLTVDVVGSGSVSKSPDQATYHYNDVVQLTASASAGWSFSAWSGDLTGSTSPASITISGDNHVTSTFVERVPTLIVTGAYQGARLGWSDVGVLSYNLYYSTGNDPNGATRYKTGVTGTTYDLTGLPASTWDKTCYFWVAPVRSDGEASKASWGANSDKVWAFKIEITSVIVEKHGAGDVKIVVEYRSRYLGSEGITVGIRIGEYLGPGTTDGIPNRKISIVATNPITLPYFMSTEYVNFESSSGEFALGSSFKAWIFLWNQLPSDPGYWEAYADKAELMPITITSSP